MAVAPAGVPAGDFERSVSEGTGFNAAPVFTAPVFTTSVFATKEAFGAVAAGALEPGVADAGAEVPADDSELSVVLGGSCGAECEAPVAKYPLDQPRYSRNAIARAITMPA